MHAVYNLYSHAHNVRLCLRVPLDGEALSLPSVEAIYYNANWHERELFDLFGINIEGHSDLRRIIMPMDWEGHPLRKDYPLGYEEPQFTFNYDEIDQRKHKARLRVYSAHQPFLPMRSGERHGGRFFVPMQSS